MCTKIEFCLSLCLKETVNVAKNWLWHYIERVNWKILISGILLKLCFSILHIVFFSTFTLSCIFSSPKRYALLNKTVWFCYYIIINVFLVIHINIFLKYWKIWCCFWTYGKFRVYRTKFPHHIKLLVRRVYLSAITFCVHIGCVSKYIVSGVRGKYFL